MTKPLLAGRVLVFVGLMVFAFNLRTAVAALGPIVTLVRESYPLSTLSISIIGAIAPASFVLASLTVPRIARRTGLIAGVLGSLILIFVGHLARGLSTDWVSLAIGTFIVLYGSGAGNVLMPPLVKRYFPDRIGLMTSLYMTMVIVGSGIPPLVALPVAQATSWQFSLAEWASLALVAAWPWLIINVRERRDRGSASTDSAGQAGSSPAAPAAQSDLHGKIKLYRSPTAWAIGFVFAIGSTSTYTMFAWLPTMAVELAHVDYAQGGAMVSLYTNMALPSAILVPIFAQRIKRVDLLIHFATVLFIIGFAGFILAPAAAPWVWVTIMGSAPLVFPLAVVLINLRTESQSSSLQLSGFAQAIAYFSAAVSPLLAGISYEIFQSWIPGLITLAIFSSTASLWAFIIKRGHTVEQDLAAQRAVRTSSNEG